MKTYQIIKDYISQYHNTKPIKKNFFLIMIGVPGSGKSTHSKFIEKHFNCVRIASDDIKIKTMGNSKRYSLNRIFTIQYFLFDYFLTKGVNIISDSNSDKELYQSQLVNMAREHHYVPIIVHFKTDKCTLLQRLEERKNKKLFYVDEKKLDKYFKDLQIPQDAYVIDTSFHFEITSQQLLSIVNKELTK